MTGWTFQVLLDNGKAQGTYGLGPTRAEALGVARSHWRLQFGGQPARFKVLVQEENATSWDCQEEGRFTTWKALEE